MMEMISHYLIFILCWSNDSGSLAWDNLYHMDFKLFTLEHISCNLPIVGHQNGMN